MYIWGQTEMCPHCETENEYLYYNPEEKGYIVECKGCGKKIFLCDACLHAHDNPDAWCNWSQGECFRGIIKEGD